MKRMDRSTRLTSATLFEPLAASSDMRTDSRIRLLGHGSPPTTPPAPQATRKTGLRILNGISPVSLQSTRYLSDALRKLGHRADIVVFRGHKLLVGYADRNLNIDLTKPWRLPLYVFAVLRTFISALHEYDIFHFHYGHTFFPINLDLFILRFLGKRVFMEYHGSDIRRRTVFQRVNPNAHQYPKSALLSEKESFRRQRRVAKCVDGIIVHDQELRENLYPFNRAVYLVPLRIDTTQFPFNPPIPRQRLIIGHAPSRASLKGTPEVIQAVHNLATKYDIQFRLISDLPRDDALLAYADCDIVVDQLLLGTYGMFAIECMALGKPVVAYIREDLADTFPATLPIYNANVHSIETRLEDLINDYALRRQLGEAGRAYVCAYHESTTVARLVEKVYSSVPKRPSILSVPLRRYVRQAPSEA